MDSLCKDLGNCSFIRRPGDTVSILCKQYLGDLSRLLDKHAPLVTRTFTKQATGWLSDSYRLAKNIRRQLERNCVKINLSTIKLDFENRLLGAIHWSTKIRQVTSENWSEKMLMTPSHPLNLVY